MSKGIIRLSPVKADFEEMGGAFHRMHCGIHITVASNPVWKSGLAEDNGHKCEWKDKHCDIESRYAGMIMKIAGMDYDKEHGQVTEALIGEVDLGVGEWLVPAEKEIEVFHLDKHGHKKKAGHIVLRSEFIPIPEPPHPVVRIAEHFEPKHEVPNWNTGHLRIHPHAAHITHDVEPGRADRMDPFVHMQVGDF